MATLAGHHCRRRGRHFRVTCGTQCARIMLLRCLDTRNGNIHRNRNRNASSGTYQHNWVAAAIQSSTNRSPFADRTDEVREDNLRTNPIRNIHNTYNNTKGPFRD